MANADTLQYGTATRCHQCNRLIPSPANHKILCAACAAQSVASNKRRYNATKFALAKERKNKMMNLNSIREIIDLIIIRVSSSYAIPLFFVEYKNGEKEWRLISDGTSENFCMNNLTIKQKISQMYDKKRIRPFVKNMDVFAFIKSPHYNVMQKDMESFLCKYCYCESSEFITLKATWEDATGRIQTKEIYDYPTLMDCIAIQGKKNCNMSLSKNLPVKKDSATKSYRRPNPFILMTKDGFYPHYSTDAKTIQLSQDKEKASKFETIQYLERFAARAIFDEDKIVDATKLANYGYFIRKYYALTELPMKRHPKKDALLYLALQPAADIEEKFKNANTVCALAEKRLQEYNRNVSIAFDEAFTNPSANALFAAYKWERGGISAEAFVETLQNIKMGDIDVYANLF